MPDVIASPAGNSAATTQNTGNSGTAAVTVGTGSQAKSSPEPKVGWAGDENRSTGAEETRDDGAELETSDEAGEFGDESFEDADLGDDPEQKKEVPFKDLLEQLKSQDPAVVKAAEKQMKRDFFENRRYKQIPGFETPEKARAISEKLESFGGIEGIERETQEAATMYTMLGAGDPAILDELQKDYGEGLAKLAPHVLDRFEKLDPKGWAHSMASVFMATLNQAPAGGISALAALNGLMKQFPEAAKSAEFQRVAEVVNTVAEIAAQAPQQAPQTDDKFKKREQELSEKDNQLYRREVSAQVLPELNKSAINAISIVMKGRKITPEAMKELRKDVNLEYAQLAKKDEALQKNLKALLAGKNTEGFIKTVKSHLERTMLQAAKRVKRKNDGISGISAQEQGLRRAEGDARREAGGGGSATGTIKTATPAASDVDWSRMRSEFGRDKADDFFMFQRRYYKKGDAKNTYSY